MNLFIESIEHHKSDGTGYAGHEQRLREAYQNGQEFSIDIGKRAEFTVEPGEVAVVYLLEGAVRFEGDDTPAGEGDTVWFKPAPRQEAAQIGIQADRTARGILVNRPARPGTTVP